MIARKYQLNDKRVVGPVKVTDFKLVEEKLPELKEGGERNYKKIICQPWKSLGIVH